MNSKFPFYKQPDIMDCGPTCLRMVAKFHGRSVSLEKLRRLSETTREGSSLHGLAYAAEHIGFRSLGAKVNFLDLKKNAPLPCICFWNERHYVVVYKIKNDKVFIADPGRGKLVFSIREFLDNWIGKQSDTTTEEGIVLLFEPSPALEQTEEDDNTNNRKGFHFLYGYLRRYRRSLIQICFGLFATSLLQLIFPFLTQSVVDIGIQNKNVKFLYLVLFGQLFVFVGRTVVEIIRGWVLLHLSTRINISLVSDFLIKLMKLPISFFDTKMTGDIVQRINDHKRIENLLTNQSLNVLFSTFNFIVFSVVLVIYSLPVFVIFLVGTILYFIWIQFFLKKRKDLDHKRFFQDSEERSKLIELVQGMQEIKLNNAERNKRWGWERVQVRLFKLQMRSLRLEQLQSNGAMFINELKNILVSFYVAKLVIDGQLTLGMMLSVSYIIGQLNSPISQFMVFVYSFQDAKISLERLNEIHNKDDEENQEARLLNELPEDRNIVIEGLSFRYFGSERYVLEDLNFTIPANKITAVVGASGSGKTTLMKLLLRFYEPQTGKIKLGTTDLENLTQRIWREHCGTVMQEGYIFNDTIANNIAIGEERIDKERLKIATQVANIEEFILQLPLGFNTKIGNEGVGISGGQKQRLLIARAVYKNPSFLFFDEATSSLDSRNEKIIMENLDSFFQGRTAVVIAHRLSTVKNADQIIVLDKGKIAEKGTHRELLEQKGLYHSLVHNQLELEKIENNLSTN